MRTSRLIGSLAAAALGVAVGAYSPHSHAAAPKLRCGAGTSLVELPAPAGATLGAATANTVLRCIADSDGNPHGPEIWITPTGRFFQRGNWERGQRSGVWERWWPSGHVYAHHTYMGGNLQGSKCLNEKRQAEPCTPGHGILDWSSPGAAPAPAPTPTPTDTTTAPAPDAGAPADPGAAPMPPPTLPPAPNPGG